MLDFSLARYLDDSTQAEIACGTDPMFERWLANVEPRLANSSPCVGTWVTNSSGVVTPGGSSTDRGWGSGLLDERSVQEGRAFDRRSRQKWMRAPLHVFRTEKACRLASPSVQFHAWNF